MEIHAPHQPIHSLRDVLLHLAIVTIGILIALGLETGLEWRHNLHLAEEARENIRAEMGDNRREIDYYLKTLPEAHKMIANSRSAIETIRKNPKATGLTYNLALHGSDLSTASWDTAQSVGAFAFMTYGEVKRYDAVYGLQKLVSTQQQDTFQSLAATLLLRDPAKATPAQLERLEGALDLLETKLTLNAQFAQQLEARYDAVLGKK